LIIGGSRIIERAKSPAFQATRSLRRMYWAAVVIRPKHIQELQRTLKELFDKQQASVHDEDNHGNTLLYVSP
jgi:hypothetical protein